MRKLLLKLGAFLSVLSMAAFADGSTAPTDFASALPASLIPDGFWSLVGIVFTAVATVWGITKGIRLFKKA